MFVAAPDLPGTRGLTSPEALLALPWVTLAIPWPGPTPLVRIDGASNSIQPEPVLRLGAMSAVRDAIIAGAGVGMLPVVMARPEIAAGRLVRLLPDWATPRKAMFFVYPSAQSVTARLRVLIDFLAREIADLDSCESPPVSIDTQSPAIKAGLASA